MPSVWSSIVLLMFQSFTVDMMMLLTLVYDNYVPFYYLFFYTHTVFVLLQDLLQVEPVPICELMGTFMAGVLQPGYASVENHAVMPIPIK